MRNAFLGRVRLNQGKISFRLKVIKKKPAGGQPGIYAPLRVNF